MDDRRAFGTLRHLRKIYPDPVQRGSSWGVIGAADGGIAGVYSLSQAAPLRQVAVHLYASADVLASAHQAESSSMGQRMQVSRLTKANNDVAVESGEHLAALHRAAGFTNVELAGELRREPLRRNAESGT